MNRERTERIKALFHEALDRPPKERRTFLEEACEGDAALRAEVEALLESHEAAGAFLETPALPVSAPPPSPSTVRDPPAPSGPPPEAIGPYRIVKVLGEGGMGIVYLAEQTEPVQRRVALKVVKLGLDSREVTARFDLERRALALMSHSGIAKVFDAGTTAEGRPYFVMEYVPGLPITKYCDDHRLSIRDRLLLFVQVCEAVQHAHQKGIIHRDLKPSNVLVTREGNRAVPKIIDFGVARAVKEDLFRERARTRFGAFVGTLEYMSPEQADPGASDLDTRSDIYTLGVLLYESLTGTLPFRFEEDRTRSWSEILWKIREEVPLRPSRRVTTLASEAPEVFRRRNIHPGALRRRLAGDLDWIVLKALEKDPARRYASASELAEDVRRHLRFEPVLAGPPGALYRVGKLARKHRKVAAALAALVLSLAAGLFVSTRLYLVAARARRAAEEAKVDLQNLADLYLLESLEREATELWPARREKIPEMKAWLRRAEDLAARLPAHRARLAAIRTEALPYDAAARRADLEGHPDVQRLEDLRRVRARWAKLGREPDRAAGVWGEDRAVKDKVNHAEAYIQKLDAGIAALERQVRSRRTWRFADPERQWIHDKLARLVQKLTRFTDPDPGKGTVAEIRRRIAQAEAVERRTLEERAEAWRAAVAAIGDPRRNPAYGGLALRPQAGLVPLGPDPDSGLWEFALPETGRIPERDEKGRIHMTGKTALVMVLLPGGTFSMGARRPGQEGERGPNVDPFAYPRSGPVHAVTLTPFFISKYEMTQGQWERLTGKNPSFFPLFNREEDRKSADADALPVNQVSWYDCREVLRRVGLELPTEAQWEYAARAGTTTVWHTGDDMHSVEGYANLCDRSAHRLGLPEGKGYDPWLDDGYPYLAPVGRLRPNRFGLYDTMGNVYEWCRDIFEVYEAPVRPGDGLRLTAQPENADRIVRGGGYQNMARYARPVFRVNLRPSRRAAAVGVRPVRPVVR